jgi:hypothetical protein
MGAPNTQMALASVSESCHEATALLGMYNNVNKDLAKAPLIKQPMLNYLSTVFMMEDEEDKKKRMSRNYSSNLSDIITSSTPYTALPIVSSKSYEPLAKIIPTSTYMGSSSTTSIPQYNTPSISYQ